MLAAAAGGETEAPGRKSTDRTFNIFATESKFVTFMCACFVYASLRFDVALSVILSV